jgi:hypothetical protein
MPTTVPNRTTRGSAGRSRSATRQAPGQPSPSPVRELNEGVDSPNTHVAGGFGPPARRATSHEHVDRPGLQDGGTRQTFAAYFRTAALLSIAVAPAPDANTSDAATDNETMILVMSTRDTPSARLRRVAGRAFQHRSLIAEALLSRIAR